MIDTSTLKEFVYSWFSFLYGDFKKSNCAPEEIRKIFKSFDENIFDMAESDRDNAQKMARSMWEYLNSQREFKKQLFFKWKAEIFCKNEDCPIRGIDSNDIEDNNFFNLVVGPSGHFNGGEENEYIKIILDRLEISGTVNEAFYHDPYAISSLSDGDEQTKIFAKNFLEKLNIKLQPLIVVTKEQLKDLEITVNFKKIPKDVIHDRYIIINEDSKWKGVLVGTSINSFPHKDSKKSKPHFVISKLESADAEIIAGIIKDNIA